MNLREVFNESADLKKFDAGTVLFREGEPADFMYVIMDGSVQLTLHGKPIARAQQGEIIGEMALLNSDPRSATATAQSDCLLAPIDTHSFRLLIQHTPDFAFHVMNVLADRLRRANSALVGHFSG